MPEVRSGELEKDYVARCIPVLIEEGKESDQAAAICHSMYKRHTNKAKLQKAINIFDDYISQMEKQEVRKEFKDDLNNVVTKAKQEIENLTATGLLLVEDIYLRCRKDGLENDKSYEIAKAIHNREYKNIDRCDILRSIEEVLKNIKSKRVDKAWQTKSGEWHDYDESGKVITVNPDDNPDIETGSEYVEKPGGFVEASDLDKKDFKDEEVFNKLNNMASGELEDLFDKMGLDAAGDPTENFKTFTTMTKDQLNNLVNKARTVEGFESPEPGDIPEKAKEILASTYASCRKDGGDKEKCSKIAWGAVRQAGY